MKLTDAIDAFVRDWRMQGRMRSDQTERSYRSTLNCHLEDVGKRDPAYIGREDVKRTLVAGPIRTRSASIARSW